MLKRFLLFIRDIFITCFIAIRVFLKYSFIVLGVIVFICAMPFIIPVVNDMNFESRACKKFAHDQTQNIVTEFSSRTSGYHIYFSSLAKATTSTDRYDPIFENLVQNGDIYRDHLSCKDGASPGSNSNNGLCHEADSTGRPYRYYFTSITCDRNAD